MINDLLWNDDLVISLVSSTFSVYGRTLSDNYRHLINACAFNFENGGWIEQVENDTLCKQSAFTTKLTLPGVKTWSPIIAWHNLTNDIASNIPRRTKFDDVWFARQTCWNKLSKHCHWKTFYIYHSLTLISYVWWLLSLLLLLTNRFENAHKTLLVNE